MDREEWGAGLDGGFEAYLVVFVPTASQQAPAEQQGHAAADPNSGGRSGFDLLAPDPCRMRSRAR
ncbi:hypothetical protein ACFV80_30590 [Streptomyces sp. NPDC059862]